LIPHSIVSGATFVYCEKMDKKKIRVLMKHCFLAKKNTVEAKAWLDNHYTDSAPAKSTVEKWFAKFKRVEMSTEIRAMDARKRLFPTKTSKKSTK
jgi:hypothetical protein